MLQQLQLHDVTQLLGWGQAWGAGGEAARQRMLQLLSLQRLFELLGAETAPPLLLLLLLLLLRLLMLLV
jgi:hypothetical protein